MRLVTDFSDYYDHHFDLEGPEFRRMTTEGPGKHEQFKILQRAGYKVPFYGTVQEVLGHWWGEPERQAKWVVIYEDEQAHCGEGKRLVSKGQLTTNPRMNCPGGDYYWRERPKFCSAYVGTPYRFPSVSWRRLQIGPHVFWIEYVSADDWRSNCGETDCRVIGVEKDAGRHPHLTYPLFAIDFVIDDDLYAVDLNIAPGVRGSGVEKYLGPKEAAGAVIEAGSGGRVDPPV